MSVWAVRAVSIVFVLTTMPACRRNGGKQQNQRAAAPLMLTDAGPSQARINITVTAAGYSPSSIPVIAGRPVTLIFTRRPGGCGPDVELIESRVRRPLPENQPVEITFVPQPGRTEFKCGLRGLHGEVIAR